MIRNDKTLGEIRGLLDKRSYSDFIRFGTWCVHNGIEFQDVSSETFDLFEKHLASASISENTHQLVRAAIRAWNRLVELADGRGFSAVPMPSIRRRTSRVPLEIFQDSLRQQLDAYAEFCRSMDPFDPDARRKPLALATIKNQLNLIHYALDTLVRDGADPREIHDLRWLLDKETFRRLCRGFEHRVENEQKSPSHGHFSVEALFRLARWLKLPDTQLVELKIIADKMTNPVRAMTNRNWALVRKLLDAPSINALLDAPTLILDDALAHDGTPNLMLSQAQAGVALAILSHLPLRLHNLAGLRLGHSLFKVGDGRYEIRIASSETKEKAPIEYDVPESIAYFLSRYMNEVVEPLLPEAPPYLFVNVDGSRKTDCHLRYLVKRYSRIFIGTKVRPHVFRHLWAAIILDESPGAYELVQQFLNHRCVEGTRRFYAGTDSPRASKLHGDLLERAARQRHLNCGVAR
ncbi:MAG: site-specific integrase [Rhizobiaceae bacterium]|nr:site-specific integrase [Rhizobiaceae bacterium]